eukprot:6975927-Lingulodinium_polyedra.AAC.1
MPAGARGCCGAARGAAARVPPAQPSRHAPGVRVVRTHRGAAPLESAGLWALPAQPLGGAGLA